MLIHHLVMPVVLMCERIQWKGSPDTTGWAGLTITVNQTFKTHHCSRLSRLSVLLLSPWRWAAPEMHYTLPWPCFWWNPTPRNLVAFCDLEKWALSLEVTDPDSTDGGKTHLDNTPNFKAMQDKTYPSCTNNGQISQKINLNYKFFLFFCQTVAFLIPKGIRKNAQTNWSGLGEEENQVCFPPHYITPISELADCSQQVLHRARSYLLSFKWKLDIESKRGWNWGNME